MTEVIRIRPTTEADIAVLVELHRTAFAETMGVALGKSYLRHFLCWFITDAESLSYVACVDERIAGYVFGAPSDYSKRLNRQLAPVIAWGVVTHPQIMWRFDFSRQIFSRLRSILGYTQTNTLLEWHTKHFRLTGIGVSPAFRGRGIGQRLIDNYEKTVADMKYQRLALSVYRSNTAAKRLYERCGWRALNPDADIVTYFKELGLGTNS